MCYETTARPPYPPIAGGAATGELITLEAKDGNEFAAFTATAEKQGGPGMVVCPDVRGLHGFYEDLALRFAEQGIHATAFDYFGRTAGVGQRADDFDFMPEVMKTTPETVNADIAATAAHLREQGATSLFTVGFCFGGRISFNQAASGLGLSGVIGFYGVVAHNPMFGSPEGAPVNLAAKYESPVLGLFGGADQMITAETIGDFGKALDTAGVANELKIYDGAPHSFFDRSFDEHKAACDDAWTKILNFVKANSE